MEDAQYQKLKAVFLADGRGRRPSLPEFTLTRKLLMQMLQLRDVGGKTFDETAYFLQKRLFPDIAFSKLRYQLVSMSSRTNQSQEEPRSADLPYSNSENDKSTLLHPLDIEKLGEFLKSLHHQDILSSSDEHVIYHLPSCYGLLKDLLNFKKKEGKTYEDLCQWWQHLTGNHMTESQMTNAVAKFQKKNSKLQPSAHRAKGREIYNEFLASSPFEGQRGTSASTSTTSNTGTATGSTAISDSDNIHPTVQFNVVDTADINLGVKLAEAGKQLAAARRKEEEQKKEIDDLKFKLAILTEKSKDCSSQVYTITKERDTLKKSLDQLNVKVQDLEKQATELLSTITNLHRRLNRYKKTGIERMLNRKEEKLKTLKAKCQTTARHAEHSEISYKSQLRKLQLQYADIKFKLRKFEKKLQKKEEEARQKALQPEKEIAHPEVDIPVIRLKDEHGHFKPETKILVISLIGQCEVPAHRCGSVIQTVIRHIAGARVPDSDLPSQRSALRFADQGHVISKAHVAETLINSDHWDLHTDGTTRNGVKYVCQQITTTGGSLSLGFVHVSTEDTTTLVELTVEILEELSDLYPEAQAQHNFVEMLHGLSGLMTDRASVMKSFGKSLEEERRILLQTDEGLDFLHCNAHFLLGLGAECKKVLGQEEKDGGEQLGRDSLPCFSSYNKATECSAFRYIRMVCDCFGPRGDDQHGCRDSWLAYCLMAGRKSAVTSFRENRFNNFFQAAASIHFHRQDIQDCISNFLPKINKKIDSILADNRSEVIDCYIITVGLLYLRITGPYWSLLGGSIHYLDFYTYIERLLAVLRDWQQDPSPALDQEFPPLFPDIPFQFDANILQSLLAIDEGKKVKVKGLLQKVCTGMVKVTERQLADFLPQGKYYSVQDPLLHDKLKHSHITNLLSEECFADLDFSQFKRRSASLHHHSTVNMLKRNLSMSSWFLQKSAEEQTGLLQLSGKKAASLREKHAQMEKDAVRRRRDHLLEIQQKKKIAEEKERLRVLSVMEDLRPHQGPCSSTADVEQLLQQYSTNSGLKKALRAEILFQKLVLHYKSPMLKVTGTPLTLVNRLLELFGGPALQRLPPLHPQHRERPVYKRPRIEVLADELDSDAETDPEEEVKAASDAEEDQAAEWDYRQFSFKFQQVGEIVAVYYEDDFFIGEVTSIHNEDEANVNFMEKTKSLINGSCIYRWPRRADTYPISSAVIFAGKIVLAPSSSTGRSFIVETPDNLPGRYQAFKQHLMDNLL